MRTYPMSKKLASTGGSEQPGAAKSSYMDSAMHQKRDMELYYMHESKRESNLPNRNYRLKIKGCTTQNDDNTSIGTMCCQSTIKLNHNRITHIQQGKGKDLWLDRLPNCITLDYKAINQSKNIRCQPSWKHPNEITRIWHQLEMDPGPTKSSRLNFKRNRDSGRGQLG